MSEQITVEVAYAKADEQKIISLQVPVNCTVADAVEQSGILQVFPEIQWPEVKVGIFSRLVQDPSVRILKAGERVEIYRPLLIDPKEARAQRAAKARAARNQS